MLKFSDIHNLDEQMSIESPNKSECVSAARDIWHILTEIVNDKWYQKLMSNGNAVNGYKLRTYRHYKNVF